MRARLNADVITDGITQEEFDELVAELANLADGFMEGVTGLQPTGVRLRLQGSDGPGEDVHATIDEQRGAWTE